LNNHIVYALLDPTTGVCRYVGQTKQKVNERYRQHLKDSFNQKKNASKTHLGRWVQLVCKAGKKPILHILTETDEDNVDYAETYWISYFNGIGCKLTNHESGGNRHKSLSNTTKNKLSKAMTKDKCSCGVKYTIRKTYKTCVPCQKKYYQSNRNKILRQKKQHRLDNIEQYREKDRLYLLSLKNNNPSN
jgi:hypothetical protein